jgi:hypothetical protein
MINADVHKISGEDWAKITTAPRRVAHYGKLQEILATNSRDGADLTVSDVVLAVKGPSIAQLPVFLRQPILL